jgi:hypothetical protein
MIKFTLGENEPQVLAPLTPGKFPNPRTSHWGRGALETAENILRTLQDVVHISCNVTAEHMPRTFGM